MRLLNVEVHNVLRISDAKIETAGHHLVLVGGKNAQGKSSALTAVLMALCGRSGMDWPEIALKDGETSGWVKVELSGDEELHETKGITVELHLRKRRSGQVIEEFRVIDSTGEAAPEPRALLKRLYNLKAFDPLAFERMRPQDRAQTLRNVLGFDTTELDERYKELYDTRTDVNRRGKELSAQRAGLVFPADTPDTRISVTELVEEVHNAQRTNAQLDTQLVEMDQRKSEIERLAARIVKLKAELEAAQVQHDTLKTQAEGDAAQREAIESQRIDISAIHQKMRDSEIINRNVDRKQQAGELDKKLSTLRAQRDTIEAEMKQIEAEKQAKLEQAQHKLPGLRIDEDGVLLNDLPFDQASQAERVMASVQVGMQLNPKLRLLVCQQGNDLDTDTLTALEKVLKQHDFQMLLEFVTRSEADENMCSIVFSEGKRKQPLLAGMEEASV